MTRGSPIVVEGGTAGTIFVRVVALTPVDGHFAVWLGRAAGSERDRWQLPAAGPGQAALDACARALVRECADDASVWIEQMRTVDESAVALSRGIVIDYVAIIPANANGGRSTEQANHAWFSAGGSLPTSPSERAAVSRAVAFLRSRVEQSPIAFRLLPATFTLTELQGVYELLVGQALHKASFRRALFAAHLVAPTDEWRQERRGRPARLYRYAPEAPRDGIRGVRFDRLGS